MKRSVWGVLAVVAVAGYLGRDMIAPYVPDWAAPYLRAEPGTPAQAQARSGGRKGGASGPIAVTVAEAKAGTLPLTRNTIGTIVPVRSTTLSTEISGTIGAIYVRDGQDVTKGQQLIKLDDRTILAQIVKDQAQMDKDQATLDDARSTYARTKHLVETGVTATQTGDDALTAVKVAEGTLAVDRAALDADRVQQSLGLLKAPFDG
ncbi:efflux RND transporter periplasmic adaptor subunit, partial [Thioclava sp. BHET1]